MKNTKLTLGFMLIILLTLSTGLMAQSYSGGSGTEGDPYQIANKADLKYLSENSVEWWKHFIQTETITFTDADFESGGDFYNSGEGFSPIGTDPFWAFAGSYDGGGYTIDNLFIDRPSTEYIGLFGRTSGATIADIGVTNVDITGYLQTGGLVGDNRDSSEISNSYSTGSVDGNTYVGGLVGENDGTVSNCYSTGSVDGINCVGGLVGYNWDTTTVENSYSTGSVSSGSVLGGLIAYNDGTVSNSFWDEETSGTATGIGGGTTTGATGKTTAEMKTLSTFTDAGWDFEIETTNGSDDYWDMDQPDGSGYPFLSWENGDDTALPVNLSTFNAIYTNETLTVNWATESEENNIGWNIYRGIAEDALQNGAVIQINNQLIAGAGTTNISTEYSYIDEQPVQAGETYWYWLEDISTQGESEYSDPVSLYVGFDHTPETPQDYGLHQNYPNPFNPNTNIRFAIDYNSHIKLVIYNTKGQIVRTLADENVLGEIFYEYNWNGMDDNGNKVSSGIYMYKLVTDQETFSRKMIMLK